MSFPVLIFTPGSATGDDMADALLQRQLFPNVKAIGEELPPFFESLTFSQAAAATLSSFNLGERSNARFSDYVSFRTRRFDGLVRRMGLPHPVTYARLVLLLQQHWTDLAPFLNSPQSMIKPASRGSDPRVVVMDYDSASAKAMALTRAAQSKRYLVKADISNCFPSLYSHSLDWALRGVSTAKSSQSGRTWQEKVDKAAQNLHNRETKGFMIGPAVSNILAEIILQRIDDDLRRAGYDFSRYIDDYSAFFRTRDDAELFLAQLDRSLSQYRLVLNSRKTEITALRDGFGEPWINEVQSHLPSGRGSLAAIRFLQHCETLAKKYPEHSVLRYGVKVLLGRRRCPSLGESSKNPPRASDVAVLDELIRISYFHPDLSCFVVRQMAHSLPLLSSIERTRISGVLRVQINEAANRSETDTILWMIFGIRKVLRRRIPVNELQQLLKIEDDLLWLGVAIASSDGLRHASARARQLSKDDKSSCEQHWLSRYEFYRTGYLKVSDLHHVNERPWFEAAKASGLRFSMLQ